VKIIAKDPNPSATFPPPPIFFLRIGTLLANFPQVSFCWTTLATASKALAVLPLSPVLPRDFFGFALFNFLFFPLTKKLAPCGLVGRLPLHPPGPLLQESWRRLFPSLPGHRRRPLTFRRSVFQVPFFCPHLLFRHSLHCLLGPDPFLTFFLETPNMRPLSDIGPIVRTFTGF